MLPAEKRKAASTPPSPQRTKAARTEERPSPQADPGEVDSPGTVPPAAPGTCEGREQEEGASAWSEGTPTLCDQDGMPPAVASPSGDVASSRPESLPVAQGTSEVGASQGPRAGSLPAQKGAASDAEKDEGERELVIRIEEGESETKRRRKKGLKRERKVKEAKSSGEVGPECDIQLDDSFERALEDGAKQHNLTVVNVRNILHEVITNEHVVAMMKAAIHDTEQQHVFEPKMTRSKLKEVVEKGVVPSTWNISPMKKMKESKAPQFIDIPLEEEDSSDEEYRPEEEEEDETAEESFMESDAESTTSSPSGGCRLRSTRDVPEVLETDEDASPAEQPGAEEKVEGSSPAVRHLSVEVVPMGPPPLPPMTKPKASKDTSFMEKLHAVDEELASNEACMDSYQSLDDQLIAYRTRSKWPLNNVSLGLLEAELKAPDITADMYDPGTQDDVHWQSWMKAVMNDLDYEDDEDDPEYNFLEDLDEPDMEDFRNDRAVRITKKEVNELMEELFETFQDEMGVPDVEEDAAEEEVQEQIHSTFNTPQALRFEEPLANLLSEQHRTVKAQIEQLRQRKAKQQASASEAKPAARSSQDPQTLSLDPAQKLQLQQQMQQHVQLLSQVHLLTSVCESLQQEAETAKLFLKELASFAEKASEIHSAKGPGFTSSFLSCNLKEALRLVEEFDQRVRPCVETPQPKEEPKMNRRFDESRVVPREVAWILATRDVFMYPELLPHVALQPRQPKDKACFTKGEDNLLVLGLKHFEDTDLPKPLISQYLMPPKTYHQLSFHIKNLSVSRAPDNVVKLYRKRKVLLPMPSPFTAVPPGDMRPPIERAESRLPFWLQRSLLAIRGWLEQRGGGDSGDIPLLIPEELPLQLKPRVSHLARRELRRRKHRPSGGKPVLIHPAGKKSSLKQAGPLLPAKPTVRTRPRLIQPAPAPLSALFQLPQGQSIPPSSSPAANPGRKPWGRRASRADGRGRRPRATIVPAPPRTPVILTVPTGLKLLSLGGGCNVIRPLPATPSVAPGQPLGLAAVVVSPAAFTCSLNRPPAPDSQPPGLPQPADRSGERPQGSPEASPPEVPASPPPEGRAEEPPLATEEAASPASPSLGGAELPGAPEQPGTEGSPRSEEQPPILGLGQELEVGAPPENPAEDVSAEGREAPASPPRRPRAEEEEEEEEEEERVPEKSDGTLSAGESSVSPEDGKSQADKVEKAGQEEEDDEDFDDLTQDEEDEEVLSSASEESALSVPELQETMEKLTWLASKRQLSQEGDSEEENSQEENSEPEEEEEGEGLELLQKEGERGGEEMALTESHGSPFPAAGADAHASSRLPGQGAKLSGRGKAGCRARARRGRRRISKDTSKLLLLYAEDILSNDPLREQKDMAFAQAYLGKVREALQDVPGKYEEFLRILYDFEMNREQRTAVDLYGDLCDIIQDWPQLLKDFAAFLLPEQALQCGLFEEQQAFDKSRKFLRQLEICFAENPSQLQKIIKALQSCVVCSPPDVAELKVQVCQLLKGHHHLQDEFSLFFDQLRPPASRMNDFEEVNWTEDKEYEFDGFEEVVLPDLEEEEELQKMAPPPRSKRRREGHSHDKGLDHKAKGKDSMSSSVPEDWSPQPTLKDSGKGGDSVEEDLERREEAGTAGSGGQQLAPTAGWSWEPSPSASGELLPSGSRCCPESEDEESRGLPVAGEGVRSPGGSRSPATEDGSPPPPREGGPDTSCGGAGEQPPAPGGRHLVKFASAGAQVRFRSCQEMALAHRALRDGCVQGVGAPEIPAEEEEEEEGQAHAAVCAKNTCVSSTGERMVLWTREADRAILTACQDRGANQETFSWVAQRLNSKSAQEVSQRFRELMRLFHTSGDASTDEEDDTLANSNPEQRADWLISDEDQD